MQVVSLVFFAVCLVTVHYMGALLLCSQRIISAVSGESCAIVNPSTPYEYRGRSVVPFCPQCGAANPDSARFCDQCGAKLIPVPAPSATSAPSAPPVTTAGGPVSVGATTCPQCGFSVIPGEAFCDNCGAPLFQAPPVTSVPAPDVPFPGVSPQPAYPPPQPVTIQSSMPAPPVATPPPVAPVVRTSLAGVRLRLANGSILALPAVAQAFVGRADPVSNFYPDIDLTAHGGLEHGVGRRHGRFFVQQGQVYYEDLDSTNGSFLGGRALAPRQPAPVRHGDELRLGMLRLVIEVQ